MEGESTSAATASRSAPHESPSLHFGPVSSEFFFGTHPARASMERGITPGGQNTRRIVISARFRW